MNWKDIEKHFSSARLRRYQQAYLGDNEKAALAYSNNMLLAEAMMPLLNVLEIALRNGVHNRLTLRYGRLDWWESWVGLTTFEKSYKEVKKCKEKLDKRKEKNTSDKVIAELTFGFWVLLFNNEFQKDLWKDLRLVFPHCPKQQRKRHTVSQALNQLRILRNRVFHHEPVIWLTPNLCEQHALGLKTIFWIEPNLIDWLKPHDRFHTTWAEWVK